MYYMFWKIGEKRATHEPTKQVHQFDIWTTWWTGSMSV